jgi:hypothetical protein
MIIKLKLLHIIYNFSSILQAMKYFLIAQKILVQKNWNKHQLYTNLLDFL